MEYIIYKIIRLLILSKEKEHQEAFDLILLLSEIPLIVVEKFEHIAYLLKAVDAGAYDYVIKDSGFSYLKGLIFTVAKVITIKKVREIPVKSCPVYL